MTTDSEYPNPPEHKSSTQRELDRLDRIKAEKDVIKVKFENIDSTFDTVKSAFDYFEAPHGR